MHSAWRRLGGAIVCLALSGPTLSSETGDLHGPVVNSRGEQLYTLILDEAFVENADARGSRSRDRLEMWPICTIFMAGINPGLGRWSVHWKRSLASKPSP